MTKHDKAARWHLVGTLLTTYGYGLLGAVSLQTYLNNGTIPSYRSWLAVLAGLVFHALALYIAPKGEDHAR